MWTLGLELWAAAWSIGLTTDVSPRHRCTDPQWRKAEDIPIMRSNNVYMFDGRALKRWGLKESNLPPGSVILNRQATFWESYKWYVVGGISLILLEAFLIFALWFSG